jgi:1-acyl-sn-glycerol-3-phosphate acyltransferase
MPPLPAHSRNPVAQAAFFLWGLAADLAVALCTIGFGAAAIVGTFATRKGWPADVLGHYWGRCILAACGIRVEVQGLEHLDPHQGYVIISNHLSNFDVFAIIGSLPINVHFITKKELLRVPVLGQALSLSNHIMIDRSKPDQAINEINRRVTARIGEGFGVLFFAEGTRSEDGQVHAFKKGGVSLALQTGLPVVPLSISGTRKFLPRKAAVIRPYGRVRIVLGAPIATAGLSPDQRDELNETVRQIVVANYVADY